MMLSLAPCQYFIVGIILLSYILIRMVFSSLKEAKNLVQCNYVWKLYS